MIDFRRLVLCILLGIGFAIVLPSCTTVSPPQMTEQSLLGKQILSEQNEHYKAARDLVSLTLQMDTDALFSQLIEMQLNFQPKLRPYRQILIDFFKEIVTSNEFMDEIINIHMELFSKDELTELNTLLEAKVMIKYRQVTPQIMNGLQQVALKLMKKHASELQSRLKNEVEK